MARGNGRLNQGVRGALAGFVILAASFVMSATAPSHYLYLKIYRHEPNRLADRAIGYLSVDAARPLPTQGHGLFFIRVLGELPLFTVDRLATLMTERNLHGLDLSAQPDFGDAGCAALARVSGLRFLNLSSTAVTDRGLAALATWRDLSVLRLGAHITAEGLSALRGLPHLTSLALENPRLGDEAVDILRSFRELESLDVMATALSDAALPRLNVLPLKRLELGPGITDAGMSALSRLRKLRHLDLSVTQVTDEGLRHLTAFPALGTLFLGRRVRNTGLLELADLPGLTRSLRRLDLSQASLDDRGTGALQLFENIEELALSGTRIGDETLSRLVSMSHLRALEISDTWVTSVGLEELQKLPRLEVLSLTVDQRLSVLDLRPLLRLPKLRLLIVNGRPVAGKRLAQVMNHLRELERSRTRRQGQPDSDEFIALLGPAVPGAGLYRLSGTEESLSPPANWIHPAKA